MAKRNFYYEFLSDYELYKIKTPEGARERYEALQKQIDDLSKTPIVDTRKTQGGFEAYKKSIGKTDKVIWYYWTSI